MYELDMKYVREVGLKLEKFSEKKREYYNFRCPLCGDSKKNPNKARAFIFSTANNTTQFKCYNCCGTKGITFIKFLEKYDPQLHERYVLERYKAGSKGRGFNTPDQEIKCQKPVFK